MPKNTICEIKHWLGGINNRLDTGNKISKPVGITIETAQTEAHREKRVKNNNKEPLWTNRRMSGHLINVSTFSQDAVTGTRFTSCLK